MPVHRDHDSDSAIKHTAKRERDRACDGCRRKKSDGPQQDDHKCTTCRKAQRDCTYDERTNRHEPRKSYVEELEARLRSTESLVKRELHPPSPSSTEGDSSTSDPAPHPASIAESSEWSSKGRDDCTTFDVDLPPADLLDLSFRKQLAQGLQWSDPLFMTVVLLVCSVASRLVDDPRVLVDPTEPRCAGWQFFNQAVKLKETQKGKTVTLFDLQIQALSTIFIFGSSAPSACYTTPAAGLRMAQEVGAHRKSFYRGTPNLMDELFLIVLDRNMTAMFRTPCGIHDDAFDVAFPLEVDDSCWDIETFALRHSQPVGQPSHIAYFISRLKLHQIMGFALRTLYAINKSQIGLGFLPSRFWEQAVLIEVDSAMDDWARKVPDHLRWDSTTSNSMWAKQSAAIWIMFYFVQMVVHRRFLEMPSFVRIARKLSLAPDWDVGPKSQVASPLLAQSEASSSNLVQPVSAPPPSSTATASDDSADEEQSWRRSMQICARAARELTHIVAERLKGGPRDILLPYLAVTAGTSGIMLLLNVWADGADRGEYKAESPTHFSSLVASGRLRGEDHLCLSTVKYMERWYQRAGQAWDFLNELAVAADMLPSTLRSLPAPGRRLRLLLPRPPAQHLSQHKKPNPRPKTHHRYPPQHAHSYAAGFADALRWLGLQEYRSGSPEETRPAAAHIASHST
ncbi:hypothetical protein BKA62DRAFT_696312 [Auriculariales sp. MPI-PUGE-AT-0066]|nr:hypothetical protein BKA62DRAFT_696312 [Auriculariales sp. MPI-PUGE-AT-0066]